MEKDKKPHPQRPKVKLGSSNFSVNLKFLRFRLTGPPVVAASLGTLTFLGAGAAYAEYKLLKNETIVKSIAKVFEKRGGVVESVKHESIVVTVVAETEEVVKRIKEDCESGEILKEINENLDEYEKEHKQQVGHFDKIKVMDQEIQMTQEEWRKAKIQFKENIKEAIENGLEPYDPEDTFEKSYLRSKHIESPPQIQIDEISSDYSDLGQAQTHTLPSDQVKQLTMLKHGHYEYDTAKEGTKILHETSIMMHKDPKSAEVTDPKYAEVTYPKYAEGTHPKYAEVTYPKYAEVTYPKYVEVTHPKNAEAADSEKFTNNLDKYICKVIGPEYAEMLQAATYQEKFDLTIQLVEFKLYEAEEKWHGELFNQAEKIWKSIENVNSVSMEQIYTRAVQLNSHENYCESVLFFYLAFCRVTKQFSGKATARIAAVCLNKFINIIRELFKRKRFMLVKDYVMRVVQFMSKSKYSKIKGENQNEDTLQLWYWIILSYILIGDDKACNAMMREALSQVEAADVPTTSRVLDICYTNLGWYFSK